MFLEQTITFPRPLNFKTMPSPVIWLFWRSGIGIFLSCLVIVCNLPFIWIQRYNRPMLVAFAQRLEAREERKRHACADSVG